MEIIKSKMNNEECSYARNSKFCVYSLKFKEFSFSFSKTFYHIKILSGNFDTTLLGFFHLCQEFPF